MPLHSEVKRRSTKNSSSTAPSKPAIAIEQATIEQLEDNGGLVDLETAAALMTELHHAAAAAIVDHEQEMLLQEKSRRSMSSNPESVFDPSVSYASGAIPVQNMSTWDPPTPSSTTGPEPPRSHYMSHSQSSQFSSVSWSSNSLHPLSSSTPSLMERSLSADPSHGSATVTPTSSFASPHPLSTGPSSPANHNGSSASPQAAPPPTPPSVDSDHERNLVLDNIREIDVERAVLDKFRLPSRSGLNRYLAAYFNLFHHHLPFLHTASFSPATIAPPLLLAVLSIGALYTFEKEQA